MERLGRMTAGWIVGKDLSAWLMAMALVAAAYEIARREARRSLGDRAGSGYGPEWPDDL
jgi:hypothetical protein